MQREWMPDKEFARMWRNQPAPAEDALWDELRESRTGYKFSRQIKIGSYFVDFCCRQYKLVVEVDGESHDRTPEDDEARDEALRERGYEVLRFRNEAVLDHPERVVAEIKRVLEGRPRFRY